MRVLHASLHLGLKGGGVSSYVRGLSEAQALIEVKPVWVSADSDDGVRAVAATAWDWHHGEAPSQHSLGFGAGVLKRLAQYVGDSDIVHLHALRTYFGWRVFRCARELDKPIIVSPHGGMQPWLLRQRRVRKLIAERLWERRIYREADAFLAVSEDEAANIRRFVGSTRVDSAPIGIAMEGYGEDQRRELFEAEHPQLRGKRLLVYCSTLDARKGVPDLIRAWSSAHTRHPDWAVVIAGRDLAGIEAEMKQLAAESVEPGAIAFLGELDEAAKLRLFACAEIHILPSYSESFGISVLESLASSRPVLTTTAVPWPELEPEGVGWRVEPGVASVVEALDRILPMSGEELRAMGCRGRRFAEASFAWPAVAERVSKLYREVIDSHRVNQSA